MNRLESTLVRGAVAGIAGGVVLAAWFLVVDTARGVPFGSVAFVSSAMGGLEVVDPGLGLIAIYTLLHFGLFVLVGVIVAWLMELLGSAPNLLFGFVLGVALFDGVFYSGLTASGLAVVNALGWPEVLAGNLLGAIVLMSVLRRLAPGVGFDLWSTVWRRRVIHEGLVAGAVGATAVVVWLIVVDWAGGQVLYTPAVLGSAFFLGAADATAVRVSPTTVLGYVAFHYVSFAVLGVVAAAVAARAQACPGALLPGLLLFAVLGALVLGLLATFSDWILDAVVWWHLVVATFAAAAAMVAVLRRVYPVLREAVADEGKW